MDEKYYLITGEIGSGKTALINYFYNFYNGERDLSRVRDDFSLVKLAIPCKHWSNNVDSVHVNNHAENNIDNITVSQTTQCFSYSIDINGQRVNLIDTPGFNNANGVNQDDLILERIVDKCIELDSLNGIIIVVNGTFPRLNTPMKTFIEYLTHFLPTQVANNILLVITNCDQLSCNFQLNTLSNILSEPTVFYMQNSLFKWNHNDAVTSKYWRSLILNWNESCETMEKLSESMLALSEVSTRQLREMRKFSRRMKKSILGELNSIESLLDDLNSLELTRIAAREADEVMRNNLVQENHFEIDAIPMIPRRANLYKFNKYSHPQTAHKTQPKKMSKQRDNKRKRINKSKGKNKKKKLNKSVTLAMSDKKKTTKVSAAENRLDDNQMETEMDVDKSDSTTSVSAHTLVTSDDTSVASCDDDDISMELSSLFNDSLFLEENALKSDNLASNVSSRNAKESVKLMFTLPDNAAINQYKNAEKQLDKAESKTIELTMLIEDKQREIEQSFEHIAKMIKDIKRLCKGFNFVSFLFPVLEKFERKAVSTQSQPLLAYFNKLNKIIEDAIQSED